MIDELIITIARVCVVIFLFTTLLFAGSQNRGATNIPLFSTYGLVFLYVCYAFSGITFGNGISLGAEFLFAILIGILVAGFTIGNNFSKNSVALFSKKKFRKKNVTVIYPIRKPYILFSGIAFLLYLNVLTNWNPITIFTQATELKRYRLNLFLVEKDFFLFFLESIVISMLIIGLIWSVISHKDDKRSDFGLLFFIILVFLQVISTGARSPLIGFFLLFIVSLYEGRKSSSRAEKILRSIKRYFPVIFLSGIAYLGWTTSSRIEFEGLAISVFKSYFDIIDFGASATLFQGDSGVSFLLGTIIVYAADTFNNFVLRFQLAPIINHSFGYQFLFPYTIFFEPLTRSYTDIFSAWRELSSSNNLVLTNVADSATQWSTLFGDFIWDFGVIGSIGIVFLSSILLGYLVGSANRRPSTANSILKIFLVSTLIMPLINPFGSLQFHIVCIFLLGFNWMFAPKYKSFKVHDTSIVNLSDSTYSI